MIYLACSILLSTLIFVIFKLFVRFRINTFQAITFNYLCATFLGFSLFTEGESILSLPTEPWLYLGVIEGLLFIGVFVLFAISSQKAGVAITAVASKMSVILPVVFGILLYKDSSGLLKISGIAMAIVAFYLSLKKNENFIKHSRFILLPVFLFLGNGAVDTLLKVTEHYYLIGDEGYFLSTIFLVALIVGAIITISRLIYRSERLEFRNLVGGFILGLVNFFTTYCTLKALAHMESSILFPVMNSGIVTLTAISGLTLFKEKLTWVNWIGILLAVVAITLISM